MQHSTFNFIGDVASFFKLCSKRNARLTTAIKARAIKSAINGDCSNHVKLTRWTEKHSSVLAVSELYDSILLELSDLPEEPSESRRKAISLYSVMTSCKFCIALCILEHVMAHKSNLSQLLQKVDIDLRTAVDCVNNLQSLLKSYRDVGNNDTYDENYQKAGDVASFSMLATGITALGETDAFLCRDTWKLLSALKQKPIYRGCR